ncbi:hypothetical protein EHI8A_200060 [Entamoeba histolytica HM-1:IMSS-B]|uniref:Uncharacterized protein n=5 Tax=Entamoeba histolytica TaxID=5759 RepID=C4M171_ENTH1|nr:hypothetical protein EHI_107300 [Entamoeba histolytica HM-1:IMSS]EMH76570.1 hypothetical protein EHI8A_200060 [Entamoeba histolytica HM-1:IMSS-B]EMS14941.1 hypothetical protein KM1_240240 [Entamoeba histolytica HM-3:IMSS]ENY65587.1 hypothetical protein EHI7A_174540 [Entamoeba histolytica HM-1:IMSS-A]GAT94944.1 hypothetical protein CL6EHI_107300 [Entamoeba histolytica]EAL47395.1 hypothetical protein EHI_107300 [Entamoeba histolytica HM-1:IMSS]|eukprot:XP_652781.1 hypothetical protein EHI_107300 [Entamoeba histolytica HM-1:IMSS]
MFILGLLFLVGCFAQHTVYYFKESDIGQKDKRLRTSTESTDPSEYNVKYEFDTESNLFEIPSSAFDFEGNDQRIYCDPVEGPIIFNFNNSKSCYLTILPDDGENFIGYDTNISIRVSPSAASHGVNIYTNTEKFLSKPVTLLYKEKSDDEVATGSFFLGGWYVDNGKDNFRLHYYNISINLYYENVNETFNFDNFRSSTFGYDNGPIDSQDTGSFKITNICFSNPPKFTEPTKTNFNKYKFPLNFEDSYSCGSENYKLTIQSDEVYIQSVEKDNDPENSTSYVLVSLLSLLLALLF